MEQEDKILRELIQEDHQPIGPSMRFTAEIMQTITDKQAAKVKPLISKRTWFLLAFGFIGFIIMTFALTPTHVSHPNWFSNFDKISFPFDLINTTIIAIAIGLSFIIFDEIWRRRKKTPQSS